MPDYPDAIEYYVDPSRTFIDQNSHTAIVCHGTGGSASQTAQQLGDFFRTTPDETSVHYGIDRAGVICQYVPESAGAGGNGILEAGHDPFWDQFSDNPNLHTLSFETVNDNSNSLPLTDPQKQTVFKLVKYWVDTYGIPLANIKSHASLEPTDRARCPGPNFPWQELFSYLNGEQPMSIDLSTPGVSNYFQGSTDVWKCIQTGFLVGHGILGFYQKIGGDALCGLSYLGLPQSNETAVSGHPGVVYQRFERGVLCYDPGHVIDSPPQAGDTYLLHIDKGIGQDPQVAQLALENAQLTAQITQLQALPAVSNVLAVNKLAAQIVQKTQVQ